MADYNTERLHVLDDLKPVERPEHMKRWADEFLSPPIAMRVEDLPENVVERIERLADSYPDFEPEIVGDWTTH